ncbi:hypothetical protein BIY24_01685 [Halobacteriovorax marinus]|uniref:glycosyltransferase family 10 domain-containing protein n=1 Tax=Halobacteriovorax marinus TaxID=97084 RepID=UPI000BC34983|nr:glycosyltransferase family 10 [Halobacteriovorax marinus]ATH06693.1 hypothetical protein BIY24_01685 [Halobacteriovorax marinus]
MKKATLFVLPPYQNNRIFNLADPNLNRDNCLAPFEELRSKLEGEGYLLETQDLAPAKDSDFVIYNDMPRSTVGIPDNSFLIILESPAIIPESWDEKKLKLFKKVFTWNDDYLERENFFKVNYTFDIPQKVLVNGRREKCCVLIAGNKVSKVKGELYSERINAIRWFEENAKESFDLYGIGWDRIALSGIFRALKKLPFVHGLVPFKRYPSYKGSVVNKKTVLERYNFSICYENFYGSNGYITEKIFDCFFSGTIPIYLGAENIKKYIPSSCFIDKRDFSSMEELYEFINNISEDMLLSYQLEIQNFLNSSKVDEFRLSSFADTISNQVLNVIKN